MATTILPNLIPTLTAARPEGGTSLEFPTLAQPAGGGGFSAVLGRAISEARQRDTVAQQAVESFARGDDPGRIHEVMVAVSKAEISLRTVASVRNKLLDAYRDLQHVTA